LIANLKIASTSLQVKKNIFKIEREDENPNNREFTSYFNFAKPDLAVSFNEFNQTINIEAYKSHLNDFIVERNDTANHKNLYSTSIGNPRLILPPDPTENDKLKIFLFDDDMGFFVRVQTLTQDYQKCFAQIANLKYDITVNHSQILNIIPDRFECIIRFEDDFFRHLIRGEVKEFNGAVY
jgi:hypothetical protein